MTSNKHKKILASVRDLIDFRMEGAYEMQKAGDYTIEELYQIYNELSDLYRDIADVIGAIDVFLSRMR